jgi:hypothetical protein
MFRRIASVVLWGSLCLAPCPREAAALEINCVEASKYKYLYLIFGNDRRKFASYLRVSDAKLPDGETCRAVLISGRMESRKRSQELGEPLDRDKLLDAVATNRGWLATAYLASPGGNIGTGLAAALVMRMFWLKSEAPDRLSFTYWPDFIARPATASTGAEPALADAVVPPDLAEGWRTYVRAVEGLAKPTVASGRGRCASACTFSHVSAIERQGVVYVHRGQASPSISAEKSMREILESLHRSENAIIALYRSMDGGEEFVRLFQSTPAATVNPATAARYPRYISDLLRRRCKGDAEQLRDQEARVRAANQGSVRDGPPQGGAVRAAADTGHVRAVCGSRPGEGAPCPIRQALPELYLQPNGNRVDAPHEAQGAALAGDELRLGRQ